MAKSRSNLQLLHAQARSNQFSIVNTTYLEIDPTLNYWHRCLCETHLLNAACWLAGIGTKPDAITAYRVIVTQTQLFECSPFCWCGINGTYTVIRCRQVFLFLPLSCAAEKQPVSQSVWSCTWIKLRLERPCTCMCIYPIRDALYKLLHIIYVV